MIDPFKKFISIILLLGLVLLSCKDIPQPLSNNNLNYVSVVENDSLKKIDIFIDGQYFTSYLYKDSILRKPVLFPIHSASGQRITRGFPINPYPGERIDHPHHYGLWFNHGVVNEVDYWNSALIPKSAEGRYGRIHHTNILKMESGNTGILEVEKEWRNDVDERILKETTKYIFGGDENTRFISHHTTLMAPEVNVLFTDSKEGVFALRVRRELEVASTEPAILLNKELRAITEKVFDTTGVTGQYVNSNGVKGYPEVWGKRAKWMQLKGVVDDVPISIVMMDHPKNINHPPHWMTRDYGLYAVNPLGSAVYTEGEEELNFTLEKGSFVSFKNEVIIISNSSPDSTVIEKMYREFVSEYLDDK